MIRDEVVEADLEARFVRAVEAIGWLVRKTEWPGRRGAPDRCCMGPNRLVLWAELKKPKGGRLSALQKYEHRRMREAGQEVWVVWNDAEVAMFVARARELSR